MHAADPLNIHQLVHTLSYGDAISMQVIALQRCMRAAGHSSEIFALNVHPAYRDNAKLLKDFPSEFSGRVILHYSIGSPLNDLYRSLGGAERCLIYHNLTPPHWFEGINQRIADEIRQGQVELPELCRISDQVIADSEFNASELRPLGIAVEVLELPLDSVKWAIEENHGIAELMHAHRGIQVLHVGRLAPNKCVQDIIKVFYFLHHHIDPHSHLWLVGIDHDTELYSYSLKCLVHELRLDHAVTFTGRMSDGEVKAIYKRADVYLCMSEHEGFCMPIVEAMYFRLPVLAYASTATTATVGSGGILFREKHHAEIAALIAQVDEDPDLREKLQLAGEARVKELSLEQFETRALAVLGAARSERNDSFAERARA